MGFAILMVTLFHYRAYCNYELIPYVFSIGYYGVDIFFFLSSFGLCFAIDTSRSLGHFYHKRLMRIYPTYLAAIVVSSFLYISLTIPDIILKSTGILHFVAIDGYTSFDWYIPTLLSFYLLFPAAYTIINKSPVKGGLWLIAASLVPIAYQMFGGDTHISLLSISRLPVFIAGIIAGVALKRDATLSKATMVILCSVGVIGLISMYVMSITLPIEFLWNKMLYWTPFLLITPGLCIILAKTFSHMPGMICRGLKFLGSISLEMYLLQVFLLRRFSTAISGLGIDHGVMRPILCVGFVIALIVAGYVFQRLISAIVSQLPVVSTKIMSIVRQAE